MKDFLSVYLDYTKENEAPELFHLWSAIAVVGHVLNRKVCLDQYYFKLYPGQIMVALVSESAVSRKTTAIDLAVGLMRALPEEEVNIIEGQSSSKSLLMQLDRGEDEEGRKKPAIGFLVADELGNLLRRESFAENLATDICALNTTVDKDFSRVMGCGTIVLHLPCVGGLFGTTPTGLGHEIPKVAQTAGLLGRIISVYQDETERANPLVEPPKGLYQHKAWLIKELYRMSKLQGGFKFDADGKEFYVKWYQRWKKESSGQDEQTGFYGRKAGHLLRVAMVFAAMMGDALVLTKPVLIAAMKALNTVHLLMPMAFKKMGSHPSNEHSDRIIAKIRRAGGRIQKSVLLQYMWPWLPGENFRSVMQNLTVAGVVQLEIEKTATKPKSFYRLAVSKGEFLAKVEDKFSEEE